QQAGTQSTKPYSTISPEEVDTWISFFTARYHGKDMAPQATKLNTSDLFIYYPATGLHEIYPEGSEQLYAMDVYVFRDGKKYRYMFRFAAAVEQDPKVTTLGSFFKGMKITKYYIARIDDSKNTNRPENIIKNGRTDTYDIKY
ncbi:MAG: hypothetical protein ABI222_00960, partial [Opitutaceae bacterium]